jgi:ATP-dependent DNA ligase
MASARDSHLVSAEFTIRDISRTPRRHRKFPEPVFIEPMQCKLVTALPACENWTFEIKFDGYRCIAVKRGKEATLFSRNQKVLNRRFYNVVQALASLDDDFVLDGELVALDSQGKPSFQILQRTLSHELPIYFYAFDLLNRDGELLLNLPFSRRRELLESLLAASEDPLHLSPLLRAPSGQVLEAAAQARSGRCRRETNRFRLRTRRAIRRVDQAPHEPRAGVRHWRLHSRGARV